MKLAKYARFAYNAASAPVAGLMLAGFTAYAMAKEQGTAGALKGLVVAPIIGAASTCAMVAVNIKQLAE